MSADVQYHAPAERLIESHGPDRVDQFMEGFNCAKEGMRAAMANQDIKASHRKYMFATLATLAVTYLIAMIITIPFRIGFKLLTFFPALFSSTISDNVDKVAGKMSSVFILWQLLWFVPIIALFVMRHVLPLERIFFDVLRQVHPQLSGILESQSPRQDQMLMRSVFRTGLTVARVLCLLFMRHVPILGPYVVPIYWAWRLAGDQLILNFREGRRLSAQAMGLAGALFLLVTFAGTELESLVMFITQLDIAAIAVSEELLQPFFIRLPLQLQKEQSATSTDYSGIYNLDQTYKRYDFTASPSPVEGEITSEQVKEKAEEKAASAASMLKQQARMEREVISQNYWQMLGFGLPVVLALSIPIVGLYLWGFAQGAAAELLVSIVRKNNAKKSM